MLSDGKKSPSIPRARVIPNGDEILQVDSLLRASVSAQGFVEDRCGMKRTTAGQEARHSSPPLRYAAREAGPPLL